MERDDEEDSYQRGCLSAARVQEREREEREGKKNENLR